MHAPLYTLGATGYDDIFAHATRLFIPTLLRVSQVRQGHHVLDMATGTGEAAAAAAAIVGPAGSVTAGDISPAMLDIARSKLRDTRVSLEVVDAHALPYADRSFDVVLCQLGLMLFADPARALSEFLRVLRPNGRIAVTVSTAPERTLFLRVAAIIARHAPDRADAIRKHFGIADETTLHGLLGGAGFREVGVETECHEFQFASFDDYFGGIENGATLSGQEYLRLSPDVRQAVRRDVQQALTRDPTGPFTVPMEVLIGGGRR